MCENSSDNPAAALREARRRKILENSANRLKLIQGVSSPFEKASTETFLESKPEPETQSCNKVQTENLDKELNSKITDFIKSNKELKEVSDFLLKDRTKISNDEADEEEVTEVFEEQKYSFLTIFFQRRLHYVFLALTVNILFLCDVGNLFYENVFCPFYSVKVIEIISTRRETENFQPIIFLLTAALPISLQKITKNLLSIILTLVSDLCIYLFTFIIGTKILHNQN